MKIRNYLVIILILTLLSLTACSSNTEETPPAPSAPTSTIAQLESTASTPEPTSAAQPTATAGSTTAPAPTTAVQKAEVKAQALTNLNLRGGPGTNYSIVGQLPANNDITVIGRNEDGDWLQATTAADQEVWLSSDPALVKVDQALVTGLPVVESPPPPYNASNPQVNRVLNQIPLVVHHGGTYTCASHGGLNYLLPDVREGNVIGPYAGDFVYEGNNVLFKVSGGSLVLIRENPVARFEGGAESLPFDKAMQLFESGQIVWNGDFGQTGRGIPGCDPKTP